MNVTELVSFDKEGNVERFPLVRKLFLSLVILLVAGLSFGLGRLTTAGKASPIKIEYDPSLSAYLEEPSGAKVQTASVINAVGESSTSVVGSSKGTKYHYSHCPGAKQISEGNKVVFASPAAAEASGYTLALNCSPK